MQQNILTKKDLEEVLDKKLDVKFNQYQSSIVEAVDFKFQKMEQKFDGRFQQMEQKFDGKFQAMEQRFDSRLQAVETEVAELRQAVRDLTTAVDKFLHRLDRWEQEFTLLKADVDKIKEILKEKLGVEVAIQG